MERNATTHQAELRAAVHDADIVQLPEFITVDEAARLLRLNRKSLYDALQRGCVPGAIRIGKSYRIAREVLVASVRQTHATGREQSR